MHLANFSGKQTEYTLRIQRTDCWLRIDKDNQYVRDIRAVIYTMQESGGSYSDRVHEVYKLSVVSTNMTDQLLKYDVGIKLKCFIWLGGKSCRLPTTLLDVET
ncbi:hypothetical protein XENOCAPTIV_003065 [Xenoophorus captivus]|uniref:Uncharacterized protein n=1 Tax=Xenoophorus captivus TaxID=1517983 RepID=A0ABV0RKL2_9TELE